MVQKHHINIANIQFAQSLVYGFVCIAILIRIQLGSHKDFITGYARLADTFTDFPFIAVKEAVSISR